MRPLNRKLTHRGLGIVTESELANQGDASSRPLKCPPAVVSAQPPTRYSYVAPRRPTLSMPLPEDDAPASRRRQTWRMPVVLENVA